MTDNDSALLRYAMIISVQKLASDKFKYNRLPKNTETQQENTKENTKKRQLKLGITKKDLLINSENL